MRQFWRGIRDYLALILMLATSLVVMMNANAPMLRSMRLASLDITGAVESKFAWVGRFATALDDNERLRQENIELSGQVSRLREFQIENARLNELFRLQQTINMGVKATRIVERDITRQKNTMIIDLGSEDEVEEGMPVINERGLLGKVVLAGSDYSSVQTYLNTDFRVTAMVEPNETMGIVLWDGVQPNRLRLRYVVRTEPIEIGQRVVTRGSAFFPSGIPIGTIDHVEEQDGQNELLIYLLPAAPIGRSRYGFVLDTVPDSSLLSIRPPERE